MFVRARGWAGGSTFECPIHGQLPTPPTRLAAYADLLLQGPSAPEYRSYAWTDEERERYTREKAKRVRFIKENPFLMLEAHRWGLRRLRDNSLPPHPVWQGADFAAFEDDRDDGGELAAADGAAPSPSC